MTTFINSYQKLNKISDLTNTILSHDLENIIITIISRNLGCTYLSMKCSIDLIEF